MADDIKLEVVTPEKSVIDESVRIIVAPGILGEFGVLSGHTPFLSSLKTGSMRFIDTEGKDRVVFVSGGFAETLPDKVTVLAESAERRRNIDIVRAKASADRAKERLSLEIDDSKEDDKVDFARAKASLIRAIKRIQIAES